MLVQSCLCLAALLAAAPKRDVIESKYPNGQVRLHTEVLIDEKGNTIEDG